jgi:hypothetical protein
MKKEQAQDVRESYIILSENPLIRRDFTYVMVSHGELDNLIAKLMHLAELDSDKEHREALKGEIKHRVRGWLDELYYESGYRDHQIIPEATVVDIAPVNKYQ